MEPVGLVKSEVFVSDTCLSLVEVDLENKGGNTITKLIKTVGSITYLFTNVKRN